jgi:hypothetical protein
MRWWCLRGADGKALRFCGVRAAQGQQFQQAAAAARGSERDFKFPALFVGVCAHSGRRTTRAQDKAVERRPAECGRESEH